MTDLTNPRLIKLKGLLFLCVGSFAALLLFLETTDAASRRLAGSLDLVLLPILLLCVLCDRALRRSDLSIFRPRILLPLFAQASEMNVASRDSYVYR
jgi:hypothetical protein